jgi:hypothetical protein
MTGRKVKIQVYPLGKTEGKQTKTAIYKGIDSGLKDVREILDGKQARKTLDEVLNEL